MQDTFMVLTLGDENLNVSKRDRKKRKICQHEKDRVIARGNDSEEKRRIKNKRLVLPVEFVNLVSDYLTWEDLSKKNPVPIIINNPSLFRSCSLNSGITDFEYFSFRNPRKDEMDSSDSDANAKMGYQKLKRYIERRN